MRGKYFNHVALWERSHIYQQVETWSDKYTDDKTRQQKVDEIVDRTERLIITVFICFFASRKADRKIDW